MSGTKHTEGPWEMLATCDYDHGWVLEDGLGYRIAMVPNMSERHVNKANARLIAAAPELLGALTDLLQMADFVSATVPGAGWRMAQHKARAVIAKAVGHD